MGETKLKGVVGVIRKWYAPNHYVPPHVGLAANARGLERGTRVDKEMNKWARGEAVFHIHPYTTTLIKFIRAKKWLPVTSQFVVGDERARIGTAADVVVRDETGRVILLEIKTGMDNYFDKASGSLQPPLDKITCTARHLAMLQLQMTELLYQLTTGTKPHAAFVLRAFDKGVQAYPLPKWCSDKARADMLRRMRE